jgi:hypothetical protein
MEMNTKTKLAIKSSTAGLVRLFIDRSKKTQAQICLDIGLSPNSNVLTLFKSGRSPLPIGRSAALADSCDCSEIEKKQLVASCLFEYYEDVITALSVFSGGVTNMEIMEAVKSVNTMSTNSQGLSHASYF